jgi:hypothetical protein
VLCAEIVSGVEGVEGFKSCPYGFVFSYLNTLHFSSPPLVFREVVLLVRINCCRVEAVLLRCLLLLCTYCCVCIVMYVLLFMYCVYVLLCVYCYVYIVYVLLCMYCLCIVMYVMYIVIYVLLFMHCLCIVMYVFLRMYCYICIVYVLCMYCYVCIVMYVLSRNARISCRVQ